MKELAFFGEAYFHISDKLILTAGLRYFDAHVDRINFGTGIPLAYDTANTRGLINEERFQSIAHGR
ncbi:MAG: hypothetical protein HC880_10460 [Bacteroidia bacterium]|nr:hypothetical protein [Bacteroidia bacterium]